MVTTSPVSSGRAGQHDVERLVEHDLGAAGRASSSVDVGMHRHPHLAAAGEHVDGAVVVAPEQRAVGRRRLGELVDLVAQGGDVLARLAQGVGQLLVLGHGLGQLALGLEQPLLEGAHPLGGVWQPPPQRDDLLLEHPRPARAARPAPGRRQRRPSSPLDRPSSWPSLTGITSSWRRGRTLHRASRRSAEPPSICSPSPRRSTLDAGGFPLYHPGLLPPGEYTAPTVPAAARAARPPPSHRERYGAP